MSSKYSDALEATLIMAGSKIMKRTIPAHEARGQLMSSLQLLDLSQVLGRERRLIRKDLVLISPTDSTCLCLMFNPGMNIQNILLKQLVMKSLENMERIFNYLPHSKIILNWIPGTDNPSDFLSKLVIDPVKESNSPFYKTGSASFKSKSTIMANTFMTITKEGRIWSGLSEDITRIKENAARLKELAAISFKDNLANSETREMIRKEEECLICQIDKIPLTPCKDHGREDLLQGVCVLAMQTRAVAKNMAKDRCSMTQ